VFSIYVCHSDSSAEQPEERITMHWLSVSEVAANLRTNPNWPEEVIDAVEKLG